MKNLTEYINEAKLTQFPNDKFDIPYAHQLRILMNDAKNVKNIDWEDWFDFNDEEDKNHYSPILSKWITDLYNIFDIKVVSSGDVEEGEFSDPDMKAQIGLSKEDHGFALHSKKDGKEWTIFTYKKKPTSAQKSWAAEFVDLATENGWTIGETF